MRGHSLDRILASSALALVLGSSAPALSQSVSPEETARVESRVPVPDTTLPPAITAGDVVKPASVSATAAADRHHAIDYPGWRRASSGGGNACPRSCAGGTSGRAAPPRLPLSPHPPPSLPLRRPRRSPPSQPPPPSRPPATASNVVDQELSDKLRDLITSRNADRYFARRNERTGAEEFYKQRNYEPLFVADRKQSPRGYGGCCLSAEC